MNYWVIGFVFALLLSFHAKAVGGATAARDARESSIQALYSSGRYAAALSKVKMQLFLSKSLSKEEHFQSLLMASLLSAQVGEFSEAREFFVKAELDLERTSSERTRRMRDSLDLLEYDLRELETRHRAERR